MPGSKMNPVPPAAEDTIAIVFAKVKYARSRAAAFEDLVRAPRRLPVRNIEGHRATLAALLARYERDLAWVKRAANNDVYARP